MPQNSVPVCSTQKHAEAVEEVKWLRILFEELFLDRYRTQTLEIRTNSQSALKLMENPVYHQKSKHTDLKYISARNEIETGLFSVMYPPRKEMVANNFTNPVSHQKNTLRAAGCVLGHRPT